MLISKIDERVDSYNQAIKQGKRLAKQQYRTVLKLSRNKNYYTSQQLKLNYYTFN